MCGPTSVKEATREELRVIEVRQEEQCCEPECGPDTCA